MGVLTREYPPDVYGGAGVHVDFLVRELRRLVEVDVHCFGAPREGAIAHATPASVNGTESRKPMMMMMRFMCVHPP